MKHWLRLLAFTLLMCTAPRTIAQPPPTHELRGVFLTTTNSLDWPPSINPQEQQATLRMILADMKRAHLNAVFFQVRARGDAYYRSRYEPWAENLTGKLGTDPGWDPLQFLLQEAHELGIEVHAWFNVYKILGPVPPPPSSPQHPARAFPQWVVRYDNELWLDPGLPAVRRYLIDVLSDLVDTYDIHAVCFDFIRYPGKDFPDSDTYRRYGNGAPRDQWRRENINAFVREAHAVVSQRKPHLKLGAAPLGNYGGPLSAHPSTRTIAGGVEDFLQDARTWVKNRWLDYLVPQVYWTIEFETQGPDFSYLVRSWRRATEGRHIYVGIGAYKSEIAQQIPDQITASRILGTEGQVFFRYEHVRAMHVFGDRYNVPAAVPPMPWKREHE